MNTTYEAARTAKINARAAALDALNEGDGISVSLYSDVVAGTIIRKTKTLIVMQEDDAELINGDQLIFHPGGFAAHCENQRIQEYRYTRNPKNRTFKVTRRTYLDREGNRRVVWKLSGTSIRGQGGNAHPGRRKFHDYNF